MFFKPIPPPYEPLEWAKKPFAEKSRMVCLAWAMQGYGAPLVVYAVYALKIALYVYGWAFFCGFSPDMGRLSELAAWWTRPEAFQKAILWSTLFEIVGLGCGSGPLTGRYMPPLGGALYFLRPGTTKLPVFEGAPVIGGIRRTWLDVGLYGALLTLLLFTLVSSAPPWPALVAIAVLLPVLGVLDKTLFLAARGEHYWTTNAIFAMTADWVPGAKGIQAALWFWAGFSKLNHHFPGVVGVMTSNSPFTRFAFVRRLMYRRYPEDLSPSALAVRLGHAGTALELTVPLVLLAGDGGTITVVGLVMMLFLHTFITSNVPMGVPLEWNVMVVYGGFYLFSAHAGVSLFEMGWDVALLVVTMGVALPLAGNVFPAKVPFLLSMRYYAGNWAYGVWLLRESAMKKLDRLTKAAPNVYDQLDKMYDHGTSVGMVGKVMAFRLMHLHGRLLPRLVPRAVDRFEEYEWLDGEIIAGLALGWNFGDGHLHREQFIRALQAQCGFEEGEVRCILVESEPLGRGTLHYRIVDACTGLREEGHAEVAELRRTHPWGGLIDGTAAGTS